ncbi:MAG: SDR family oxidoreductase [Polyangia bacterium]
MTDKVVLITGATAGIGRQTALELAKLGAHVIIVARNPDKKKRVVEELKQQRGNANIDSFLADLSSMHSIRELAKAVLAKYPRIDVLVNNAGAINLARETTIDGYERTFATNHLAYFLLSQLLLPALEAAPSGRIVNVSSDAHRAGRIDFSDLQAEKSYSMFKVYGRSKLANIYFTRELARRLAGTRVTVNALHPGFVASDFLTKEGPWGWLKPVLNLFAISVEKGARTSIWLASSPDVQGVTGKYFYKCAEKVPRSFALDDAAAAQLWAASEKLVAAVP